MPGPLLLDGENEVIMLETEVLPSNPSGVHAHAFLRHLCFRCQALCSQRMKLACQSTRSCQVIAEMTV